MQVGEIQAGDLVSLWLEVPMAELAEPSLDRFLRNIMSYGSNTLTDPSLSRATYQLVNLG